MPVVLRVAGYKFFFYQADIANEPPHVHVTKEGNEAKFWLDPVKVAREGNSEKVIYATSNALSKTTCNFS
jgi:uncharacterized lipoprotein YmbA